MLDAYIGNYEIIRKIAEGGVGEVFEAIDRMLNRRVAIKCLRPEFAIRPEVVERFQSEGQTLARLNHPNIAAVFSFIHDKDRLFLAMEFVDGETLEEMIKKNGRIEFDVALSLFQQVLSAVGFAHQTGVIHRDLKPSNIMVTKAGTVKVMDFGIAHVLGSSRKTRTGHIVGTIQYMSPEQIKGERVDNRSDIYTLGILLYELITGQVPFDADSDYAIMKAQIEDPPAPPGTFFHDIPPQMEAVLLRALAKAPKDRFQSIGEMSDALEIPLEKNHLNCLTQHVNSWHDDRSLMSSVVHSILRIKDRVTISLKGSLTHSDIDWKQYAFITFLVLLIAVELIVLVRNPSYTSHPQSLPRESPLPNEERSSSDGPRGNSSRSPTAAPSDVAPFESINAQGTTSTKSVSEGMELQDFQRSSWNSQPPGVVVSKPKRPMPKIPAAEPDTQKDPAKQNSATASSPPPSSSLSRENPVKDKAENKLKVEWEN